MILIRGTGLEFVLRVPIQSRRPAGTEGESPRVRGAGVAESHGLTGGDDPRAQGLDQGDHNPGAEADPVGG